MGEGQGEVEATNSHQSSPAPDRANYTLADRIATGRTAEVFGLVGQPTCVVKLFFPGFESNAQKEFDIAKRLERLGVAASAAQEITQVDGRAGLVMRRIDGESLFATITHKPWLTRAVGTTLAELHVAMHTASGEGLPPLRQLLASQINEVPILGDDQRSAALAMLESLPDGDRICHGDFHPGNILRGPGGPVTIDWTNATAGPPLADVAKTTVLLSVGEPPNMSIWMRSVTRVIRLVLVSAYLRRYSQLANAERPEVRKWQAVVAAARLSERIPGERSRLLGIVRKAFANP